MNNTAMHAVLMVVVCFGAYAAGALTLRTQLRRSPAAGPHAVELLIVVAGLIAAVRLRSPRLSVRDGILAFGMFAVGAITRAVLSAFSGRAAGTREFEETRAAVAVSVWKRWINFSRAIVDYEFRLLLIACYFLLIGPFAIAFRFLSPEASADASTTWNRRNQPATLDSARRPF